MSYFVLLASILLWRTATVVTALSTSTTTEHQLQHQQHTPTSVSPRDYVLQLERNRPGYGTTPRTKISYRNHPYDAYLRRHRNLQASSATTFSSGDDDFEPLRIALDTTYLDEQQQQQQQQQQQEKVDWLKANILPNAVNFWQQTLSVIPVQGNLILSRNQLVNGQFCGLPEVIVPDTHLETGVPNADILLYVAAFDNPNYCQGQQLAVAILCHTDDFDRPIAGSINICLDNIPDDPTQRQALQPDYIQVLIHEMAHALGFSSNSFVLFWDPITKQPRTPRPLQKQNVECVHNNNGQTTNTQQEEYLPAENTLQFVTTASGRRTAQIVTPTVRQVVRNHFQCNSLTGAPLENQPTSAQSCLGDHWEERMFLTETMSSIQSGSAPSVLSPLTLALLEDSGWYQANYTFSQLSTFGHMAGCDFATGPCLVNGGDLPDANRGFFCNQAGTAACSSDHHWKQACTVLRYAEDPPVQWFDQDSSLGGPQQTDFCPIFSSSYTDPAGVPLSVDCRVASNVPAVNQFNEVFGSESQCIPTNIGQGLCLRTACIKEEMSLRINVRGDWINCESDFQTHQVSIASNLVPITITCPRLSQACPDLFCPFNCAGRGVCVTGEVNGTNRAVCECFNPNDTTPGCTGERLTATLPPTLSPTNAPTPAKTFEPTTRPTRAPSTAPTHKPTDSPTVHPSVLPSLAPTSSPTVSANPTVTNAPSPSPSASSAPSQSPAPTTAEPTVMDERIVASDPVRMTNAPAQSFSRDDGNNDSSSSPELLSWTAAAAHATTTIGSMILLALILTC